MDAAELDKRVKEIVAQSGLSLNAEQYRNLYASEGKKLVEETINAKYTEFEKNFNEKTIPFTTGFATSMAIMAGKYEKETGKEFTDEDQKAVFDLMSRRSRTSIPGRLWRSTWNRPSAKRRRKRKLSGWLQERADKIIAERGGLPGGGSEGFIPDGPKQGQSAKDVGRERSSEGDVESLAMAAGTKGGSRIATDGKF